jgi:ribonuclease HI
MLPKLRISGRNTVSKIYPANLFIMRFDGCSKGNPGLAGAGAVIYYDNEELWAHSFFVGEKMTNNHAEYSGLILGLQQAISMNIKTLHVEGDSLLVINQMKGTYKCNSPNLIDLYDKAKGLEKDFDTITFTHILRNLNKRADELSNLAILNHYCNSMFHKV